MRKVLAADYPTLHKRRQDFDKQQCEVGGLNHSHVQVFLF